MSRASTTRTFTPAEADIVIRALISVRTQASEVERALIDGIIRDGWT